MASFLHRFVAGLSGLTFAAGALAGTVVNPTLVSPYSAFNTQFSQGTSSVMAEPFGGTGDSCPAHAKVASTWPTGTQLTITRNFRVPAHTKSVTVRVSVYGIADVFVNGGPADYGEVSQQWCPDKVGTPLDATENIRKDSTDNVLEVDAFGYDDNQFVDVWVTAVVSQSDGSEVEEPIDLK